MMESAAGSSSLWKAFERPRRKARENKSEGGSLAIGSAYAFPKLFVIDIDARKLGLTSI